MAGTITAMYRVSLAKEFPSEYHKLKRFEFAGIALCGFLSFSIAVGQAILTSTWWNEEV